MTHRFQQKKSCPIPCTFTTGMGTGCILSDCDARFIGIDFSYERYYNRYKQQRIYSISAAGHLTKEGGNEPDGNCIPEQGHHKQVPCRKF